jgi:SH3-like domain-containing protein
VNCLGKLRLAGLAGLVCMMAAPAMAQSPSVGPSGLPLPRFVTLKAAKVNVRQGPGPGYDVVWTYTKQGLPVEIVQEFETWRKIRDSEGATGWVAQGLLSSKRYGIVASWGKNKVDEVPLRSSPSEAAGVTAYLQPGVMAEVKACHANWCNLRDPRFAGWIRQDRLWGVYPNEEFD